MELVKLKYFVPSNITSTSFYQKSEAKQTYLINENIPKSTKYIHTYIYKILGHKVNW